MTSNGPTNGHTTTTTTPNLTLYTNPRCPYAQRAHIALDALRLPHDEVAIDLDAPRPQWYLDDVNPRGLVPALRLHDDGVVLTESAVVVQFLADAFPHGGEGEGSFLPASSAVGGALRRAHMGFFIDTWNGKAADFMFATMMAETVGEREEKSGAWFRAIEEHVEPLLADAAPFFGGSEGLTFVEALTAPFVLRWYAISEDGELIPKTFAQKLDLLPNFGRWAKAVRSHPTVTRVWSDDYPDTARALVKKRRAMQQQVGCLLLTGGGGKKS